MTFSAAHIVGISEAYETERATENGVRSVMKNASAAKVQDLTAAV